MPLPIEDYGLIGSCHSAALVGRDGSIDWLCFPRFDSDACFAALLGEPRHGRWLIAPEGDVLATRRGYRDDTLVLETEFETASGAVRITDYMPFEKTRWDLVRVVEGLRGSVTMQLELIIRFEYGSVIPWVRQPDHTLLATAGPHTLELHSPIELQGKDMTSVASFEVRAGESVPFLLNYRPSHEPAPQPLDAQQALAEGERRWREWSERCMYRGKWRRQVLRSLITLKALTYAPTGGLIAAATTSLPEQWQGVRNWDYRYCWLRDATYTLNALLLAGYQDEAVAWREWLLRAAAGRPEDLQVLYSVTGERRLPEMELPWLPGYKGAAPVRIGNAASNQFQLDIYGEVMDTFHLSRRAGLEMEEHSWQLQKTLLRFLETKWTEPDEGIWEIRGPRRHFTHSKVMTWVAFDRAVKAVEQFGLDGPVERWRELRDHIHADVCERAFDARRNSFVQYYGSDELDASLLLLPLVGFVAPDDPRVRGTVEAIERELLRDGLVLRYSTAAGVDGLPAGEGAFLPCSFWLADNLSLLGRREEAEALFEHLLSLANELGLLSEEYDSRTQRMLGNFPQAMTHMALINTAYALSMRADVADHEHGERPGAAV